MNTFNERLRQILLLFLIIVLLVMCVKQLTLFLPGLLGAITLYILSRARYFQFIYNKKRKKGLVAGMYILYYLVILGIPITIAVMLLSPKINSVMENPQAIMNSAKISVMQVQEKLGFSVISPKSLNTYLEKLSTFIPSILNSTATVITNLAVMLFVLYYMLYNGREMEKYLNRIIPLKQENINLLASGTKTMVKANALGIPLISIIQGVVATIGYAIFGVQDWALWGFLTGVFAFFPVVGTMAIWVPLVIYMFATTGGWQATGLFLYSLLVTGNVDYVARITLLKRMGNVHPVITILGVIIGLGLFGFIGLVFGPLLINYVIILFEIYSNEFGEKELVIESA
ncbi:MAG: AI-2E family transporter [Gloeobacteraceae cyanobacterium ES-bin-316]|nr:AI-2E family transporter [Ferruginibacter sp.]